MDEKHVVESHSSEDDTIVGQPYRAIPFDMPADPDAGLSDAEKKAIVSCNLRLHANSHLHDLGSKTCLEA
jgi:hypothetical protein